MKYSKNLPLLGIVAAAVGILGVSTMSSGLSEVGMPEQGTSENGKVMGHLSITLTDPSGNIKAYRQTDNAILNTGFNCAPLALFGTATYGSCSATPSSYKIIALSNTGAAGHDTTLTNLAEVTATGLAASTADSNTVTTISAATSGGTASSVTTLSKTFSTTSGASAVTVAAAALQDGTATSGVNVFAAKTFGSSITVNPGDSLTVNWAITLSQ